MDENISSDDKLNVQQIEKIIEAVLFAAGYPVTYEKFANILGLNPIQIKTLAENMAQHYTDHGIKMLCYPDTCQLVTDENYLGYVKEALGIKRGAVLSNSALEVLAVVAYNQPVTRAYIEQIRGVDSGYALNVLSDRGLIANRGKLDAPGKPNLYGTTDDFLRLFGINSLTDLPQLKIIN